MIVKIGHMIENYIQHLNVFFLPFVHLHQQQHIIDKMKDELP